MHCKLYKLPTHEHEEIHNVYCNMEVKQKKTKQKSSNPNNVLNILEINSNIISSNTHPTCCSIKWVIKWFLNVCTIYINNKFDMKVF